MGNFPGDFDDSLDRNDQFIEVSVGEDKSHAESYPSHY